MLELDSNIELYKDKLKELKSALQDHTDFQTKIIVSHIFDNLNSLGERPHLLCTSTLINLYQATDFDLHDIPYANGAHFDPVFLGLTI